MSKTSMNLQDSFLNQVRRENSEVKVLLVNGTMLRGTVKGFDNFTLILSSRNGQHLVYKHAIAQLLSHRSAPMKHEDVDAPEQDHQSKAETDPATEETAKSRPRNDSRGLPNNQKPRDKEKQRPRKEGFNTLDLSVIKLTADEENTPPK